MAFRVLFLASLLHSQFVIAQNNFTFPPADGPHGVIVRDSNLVLTIGETADIKWVTNRTDPVSLFVFQGPRDPERRLNNLKLIG